MYIRVCSRRMTGYHSLQSSKMAADTRQTACLESTAVQDTSRTACLHHYLHRSRHLGSRNKRLSPRVRTDRPHSRHILYLHRRQGHFSHLDTCRIDPDCVPCSYQLRSVRMEWWGRNQCLPLLSGKTRIWSFLPWNNGRWGTTRTVFRVCCRHP